MWTDEYTKFDLRGLERSEELGGKYSYTVADGSLEWNFCTYLEGTEYYATYTRLSGVEILTSDDPTPSVALEIDTMNEGQGISVTWSSEETCE